ncbi:MAG: RND transporter, partial [Arsenicicoccus sp.]
MATLLHRLGRWCAHHRFTVVGLWAALLALTITGMLAFAKPLSNEFSIPGSRFEAVLETLQEEIPEAAGTTGTVVFRSEDGFTDAQRGAVADAVAQWEELDGVTAVDPFEAQDQLDATEGDLADGRAELEDGAQQVEDGRAELEQGRADLDQARQELTDGRAELEAGQEELDAQAATLEQSQTELDTQLQQLEAGVAAGQVPPAAEQQARAEIAAGQAQIDAGRQQLDAAQAEIDAGVEQLEAGEEEIATGQAQLEQSATELEEAEAEIAQGETDLAAAARLAELTDGFRVVDADGTTALTQVSVADAEGFIPPETTEAIQRIGNDLEQEGLSVDFSKEITDDLSSLLGPGEVIGLVIAAVVLLVMLGSLIAAGLPILMALIGVGVGLTGALALTPFIEMQSITPVLA